MALTFDLGDGDSVVEMDFSKSRTRQSGFENTGLETPEILNKGGENFNSAQISLFLSIFEV